MNNIAEAKKALALYIKEWVQKHHTPFNLPVFHFLWYVWYRTYVIVDFTIANPLKPEERPYDYMLRLHNPRNNTFRTLGIHCPGPHLLAILGEIDTVDVHTLYFEAKKEQPLL